MKTALIISAIAACYAFFATSKMLPNWVHTLCASGYDKHAHFIIFCILTVICIYDFKNIPPIRIAAAWVIIGAITEVMQHHFTNRTGDIQDFFANCAGILFALFITQLFNKFSISFQ